MDTQLSELIKNQRFISLTSDDTIATALDTLGQANITGAPVIDSGKTIGFVDVLDILAFLIEMSKKPLTTLETAESRYLNTDDTRMLNRRAAEFKLSHVRDIIDMSKRNPLMSTLETSIVRDALTLFASSGVHRVTVVDNNNTMKGIVTQSMVLRHLENVIEHTGLKLVHASDINITPLDKMVLVAPKCPAIDAFMTMYQNSVSAVAIIDGNQVIGNLSASDLKSPFARDFAHLLMPVMEWLTESRKSINTAKSEEKLAVVSCTQDTGFFDIIHRMNGYRVHRIFVVDHISGLSDLYKTLGVISLTDIIRTLAFGSDTSLKQQQQQQQQQVSPTRLVS